MQKNPKRWPSVFTKVKPFFRPREFLTSPLTIRLGGHHISRPLDAPELLDTSGLSRNPLYIRPPEWC